MGVMGREERLLEWRRRQHSFGQLGMGGREERELPERLTYSSCLS